MPKGATRSRTAPRQAASCLGSGLAGVGVGDGAAGQHADKVSATYENGVLSVTLPKREEAKPRKITVAIK